MDSVKKQSSGSALDVTEHELLTQELSAAKRTWRKLKGSVTQGASGGMFQAERSTGLMKPFEYLSLTRKPRLRPS